MQLARRTLLVSLLAAVVSVPAFAAGANGSEEEAMAMVKRGIAYIKTHGKEKALAEFSNPAGRFRDRDLYLTVTDMTGTTLAHGANQKLVGKNVLEMKDANNKLFIKAFLETAGTKGSGWVEYQWPNPVSKAIESKATYVEKFEDVVVGCGIYR